MHHPFAHKSDYRKDIDGLRAIAVIAVVLSHYFPALLPGGFVGVDIFFVISGYLITSLIVGEMTVSLFSATTFYSRRVRRIFPALLVCLITVLFAGWFYFLPGEFEMLGADVFFGATFFSNVEYWFQVDYFNTNAEFKPLLHLWSLGVEEQFYLLWPVMLLVFYRYRLSIPIVITIIVLISFGMKVFLVGGKPATFYFLHARIWELLIGALLVDIHNFFSISNTPSQSTRNTASIIGFAAVIISLFFINEIITTDNGPEVNGITLGEIKLHGIQLNGIELLPVVGTALVIISGPSAWINRWILSNGAMVYIGLISYPLYLWHWPILSFGKIIGTDLVAYKKLIMILLSFVLASLTFHGLEQPLRQQRPTAKLLIIYLMLMLTVMAAGILCQQNTIKSRSEIAGGMSKIQTAIREWDYPSALLKQNSFIIDGRIYYQVGEHKKSVLFVGDSNMEQYAARISALAQQSNSKNAIFATQESCVPMADPDEDLNSSDICKSYVAKAIKLSLARSDIDTVVFAGLWSMQLHDKRMSDEFLQANYDDFKKDLVKLIRGGKKVYIVLNIPEDEGLTPYSMFKRSWWGGFVLLHGVGIQKNDFVHYSAPVVNPLREIANETGATTIDPLDYLCTNSFCPAALEDGTPIYWNSKHLSLRYVRDHMTYLDQTMR